MSSARRRAARSHHRTRGSRQRDGSSVDLAANGRDPTQAIEVLHETVGNVHGGARMAEQRRAQADGRLRQPKPGIEMGLRSRIEPPALRKRGVARER